MSDKTNKAPENVPGKFYVDTGCIGCGQCKQLAPNNFTEIASGCMYVCKQPSSDELEACMQAIAVCPVEAIGDDGE